MAIAISSKQSESLERVLAELARESSANAVVICDSAGNILAEQTKLENKLLRNAAALAAGSFAATRELAAIIGEPGFKSISHRGRKSGMLIQSLGGEFLILVILGPESVEGLVRLLLKKVGRQLSVILATPDAQGADDAMNTEFEIEQAPESAEKNV